MHARATKRRQSAKVLFFSAELTKLFSIICSTDIHYFKLDFNALPMCVLAAPRWYSIVERGGLPRSPCWRVWAAKRVRYKVRWRRKRKKGGETRNFWWEKGAGGRGADGKKRRPLNSPDFPPFPMTGSWDIGEKAENRIGGEKRRCYFVPGVPNFSAHSFFSYWKPSLHFFQVWKSV